MKRLIKRLGIGFSALVFAIAAQVSIVTPTYALQCDMDFFEANDIAFWNPCEGYNQCSEAGDLTAPAPTELTGEDNPEKVWNYFIQRGLTPVAAAGAMGNMEQESSGFDPWAGEGGSTSIDKGEMGVGFGLIQWTNTDGNSQGRRYGVMNYLETNGVPLDATDESKIDQALLLELNWLWDQEYGGMTWQEKLNAETTVDGDASKGFSEDNVGNGSAMLFHALVERSGDGTTGKQERIDGAKTFLETYGNSGAGGDCSIGEGGLTSEQAQKIMDYYKNSETSDSIRTIFTKPGSSAAFFLDSAEALCGASDAPADKQDLMSRLANCTAFSTYFVAKYTDMNVDGWGTGKQKVGTLIDKNPGAQSGDTPKVFSVFSRQSGTMVCDDETGEVCGHTGIVLGIDGDKVIIGEASCGSGVAGIQVRESTVTEMSGSDYVYMYTDGHVNQEEILSVVNG